MIDLHMHTAYSDGQHTPAQVLALAKQAGVETAAITDHDTVDGLGEGREAAQQLGIEWIPGIEISVQGHRELHILGYCIDPENQGLASLCSQFILDRTQRKARIFSFLEQQGVLLEAEQVDRYIHHGLTSRLHFARAMVDAGYTASVQEAFDRYLAVPAFRKIDRPRPSPAHGIDVIRGAGGVPVLAHPALLQLPVADLDQLLGELNAIGLQGLECYYSAHTPTQTREYLALAKKHRLLVTVGSDFHGETVRPTACIGTGTDGNLGITDRTIISALYNAAGTT